MMASSSSGLIMEVNSFKVILLAAGIAAAAASTRAGQLEIDLQQSKVEVAVSTTFDSFVGHLEKYQAAVECSPAAALPSKTEVSFDFADLKTGDKDRDAAMLKWLEYSSNQTASFHLTGWDKTGATNIALGDLKIHGVTVAVKMPVSVKQLDGVWDISGQTMVNYIDFKLPKIRKALVLTVNPKLKVKFHLLGKIAAAK
jgi:polyisoprenoid-binding protein YceI